MILFEIHQKSKSHVLNELHVSFKRGGLKIKIFRKWKNDLEISPFYASASQIKIILFPVLEILAAMKVFCPCHFGPILDLKRAWKIKFENMGKTCGGTTSHKTNKNYDIIDVWFLRCRAWHFEKIMKHTCRYHYFTPVYQKFWWFDLQLLRYKVWLTEIGTFWSFIPF